MSKSGSNIEEHIIFDRRTASGGQNFSLEHRGNQVVNNGLVLTKSSFSWKASLITFGRAAAKEIFVVGKKIIVEETVKTSLRFFIRHKEEIYIMLKSLIL